MLINYNFSQICTKKKMLLPNVFLHSWLTDFLGDLYSKFVYWLQRLTCVSYWPWTVFLCVCVSVSVCWSKWQWWFQYAHVSDRLLIVFRCGYVTINRLDLRLSFGARWNDLGDTTTRSDLGMTNIRPLNSVYIIISKIHSQQQQGKNNQHERHPGGAHDWF